MYQEATETVVACVEVVGVIMVVVLLTVEKSESDEVYQEAAETVVAGVEVVGVIIVVVLLTVEGVFKRLLLIFTQYIIWRFSSQLLVNYS